VEFTRAHGTANDFVVLTDLDDDLDLSDVLVRALCHRRLGIGADGVLRIGAGDDGADVFMDYRNADGSIVEMCGNGVRVVAKHVVDRGLVAAPDDVVVIGTRAGLRPVEVRRGTDGIVTEVTVDMGPAIWDPTLVPFDASDPGAATETIEVDGDPLEVSVLSMGNPHAVTLVHDVGDAPVRTLGPKVETDPRFPKRTNVGFAEVVDTATIRLRVWERGVGETAACGTGACAAAAALHRRGLVDADVEVHVPGGVLRIALSDDRVLMTGPAIEVAHGHLDEAWLADAVAGRFDHEVLR
jgi:diaminopimelate epimerase